MIIEQDMIKIKRIPIIKNKNKIKRKDPLESHSIPLVTKDIV
jgi:hypothetical protein